MDLWGPKGCREHTDEILKKLNEEYAKLTFAQKAAIAARALAAGIAFKIDPLDPPRSFLEMAIKKSENANA